MSQPLTDAKNELARIADQLEALSATAGKRSEAVLKSAEEPTQRGLHSMYIGMQTSMADLAERTKKAMSLIEEGARGD
jgi:ElaB/YqjD/DUF883 family membrane-anchored ribosome-binding protein